MAIEVRIPKEITEYKEKVIFGLSVRQLVCFTIAILISIGSYFLFKKLNVSMDAASYVIIILNIPILAIGFIRKNGLPFEKYFVLIIRHKIGTQIRPYKTNTSSIAIKEGGERNVKFLKKNKIRETKRFNITKKDRKRKRKKTLQQIKRARKEDRQAQLRKKEKNQKTITKNITGNDSL